MIFSYLETRWKIAKRICQWDSFNPFDDQSYRRFVKKQVNFLDVEVTFKDGVLSNDFVC